MTVIAAPALEEAMIREVMVTVVDGVDEAEVTVDVEAVVEAVADSEEEVEDLEAVGEACMIVHMGYWGVLEKIHAKVLPCISFQGALS